MSTWKRLLIARLFVPVHRLLFRLSGGRVLSRLEGTGVLVLVTKGRKSGEPRSSPLLYFQFEEAGDLIVIASNYGQDRHPAWYLNIAADRHVSVETGGERFDAEARIAQGEECTALYDRAVAANPRFATYRASAPPPDPRRRAPPCPTIGLRRSRGGRRFPSDSLWPKRRRCGFRESG